MQQSIFGIILIPIETHYNFNKENQTASRDYIDKVPKHK